MRLSAHSLEPAAPHPQRDKAPTPSTEPGPRASSPESQESASAAGVTWAATPQCSACRPRAGSFPARLEQLPRPPIKFAQDLPLRTGDFWAGGAGDALRVRNCSLLAPQIGHRISPCSARPGSPSQVCLPAAAQPGTRVLRRRARHPGRRESSGPRATLAPAQVPADPGT